MKHLRRIALLLFFLTIAAQIIYPPISSAEVTIETRKTQYSGSGTTGPFNFNWKVFAATDVDVIKTSTAGVDTVLTKDIDYTITGTGSPAYAAGGAVTLTVALALGEKLTILSGAPYTQTQTYANHAALTVSSLNNALDKAAIQRQQLLNETSRSLKVPNSSSLSDLTITPESNKAIGWNVGATGLANYDTTVLTVPEDSTTRVRTEAELVAALSDANGCIQVVAPVTLTTSLTLTKPVYISPGAPITCTGFVLTLSAPLLSTGAYQQFVAAAGEVVFDLSKTPNILPCWFGGSSTNVGLGTANPRYSLDVVGEIQGSELRTSSRSLQTLVTFVFDDGNETDYTLMKPLFAAQGEVACSAVVTSLIGEVDRLTSAQIVELEDAGWEILSHTKTHANLTELTEAEILTELADSKTELEAMGLTINNLAYPYGAHNETVRRIAREYYRSARDDSGTNPALLDTYRLSARVADDHTALATYQGYVDTAELYTRWLIFYLHETNSDDVTALNTLIDYIQAKGISIVTINQGLDLIGNVVDTPAIRANINRVGIDGDIVFSSDAAHTIMIDGSGFNGQQDISLGLEASSNYAETGRPGDLYLNAGSVIDPTNDADGGNVMITPGTSTAGSAGSIFVSGNILPLTDDTYYLGRNNDDTPLAFKGLILKDTTNGKYYRIEVTSGSVVATDLTD